MFRPPAIAGGEGTSITVPGVLYFHSSISGPAAANRRWSVDVRAGVMAPFQRAIGIDCVELCRADIDYPILRLAPDWPEGPL